MGTVRGGKRIKIHPTTEWSFDFGDWLEQAFLKYKGRLQFLKLALCFHLSKPSIRSLSITEILFYEFQALSVELLDCQVCLIPLKTLDVLIYLAHSAKQFDSFQFSLPLSLPGLRPCGGEGPAPGSTFCGRQQIRAKAWKQTEAFRDPLLTSPVLVSWGKPLFTIPPKFESVCF